MKNYTHEKEESEIVISEDAVKQITESFSSYPDYTDLLDSIPVDDPAVTVGAAWFCHEIDRRVLEELRELSRVKHLKKVIYGKRHRKNFRNLKKVKR